MVVRVAIAAAGLAAILSMPLAAASQVTIATEAGRIEGTVVPGTRVRALTGIPFATPPVGDLRWQPPRPPERWNGVRRATAFGPRCVQGRIYADMIFRDEPSEDCLYLNVWTPASAPDRLPVMVWIHGGGFQAGSASEPRQDGARLAERGVVVVILHLDTAIRSGADPRQPRYEFLDANIANVRSRGPSASSKVGTPPTPCHDGGRPIRDAS